MNEQVKLTNADVRSFNVKPPKRQDPNGIDSKTNSEANRQSMMLLTRR